jgi:hypothetical protein
LTCGNNPDQLSLPGPGGRARLGTEVGEDTARFDEAIRRSLEERYPEIECSARKERAQICGTRLGAGRCAPALTPTPLATVVRDWVAANPTLIELHFCAATPPSSTRGDAQPRHQPNALGASPP